MDRKLRRRCRVWRECQVWVGVVQGRMGGIRALPRGQYYVTIQCEEITCDEQRA